MNLSSSPAQNVGNSEIPNLNGILQPSNALSLSNTSLHLDLSLSSPTQEGPPSTWLANVKTEPNVQEHEESTELSSSTPPLVQSTLTGVHNLPANSADYPSPTLLSAAGPKILQSQAISLSPASKSSDGSVTLGLATSYSNLEHFASEITLKDGQMEVEREVTFRVRIYTDVEIA